MNLLQDDINDIFKLLLQNDLCFYIKNKLVKQGKLILFKKEDYRLLLTLKNLKKKNIRDTFNFKIPIPFKIINENQIIKLDYTLLTLANNDKIIYNYLKNIKVKKMSKYYDAVIEIKVLPNEI